MRSERVGEKLWLCMREGEEVNGGCDEDEISHITGVGKSRWMVGQLKAMEGFSDHETHRALQPQLMRC